MAARRPPKIGSIVLDGGRAFLKTNNLGTVIVDVSDPRRLRRLGWYERGLDTALVGSYLHTADGAGVTITGTDGRKDVPGGFVVVDVSDPAAPRDLARIDSASLGRDGEGANADQVAARDGHVYPGQAILKGLTVHPSLVVIDVADPRSPREIRRIALKDEIRDLAVRGSLLYATMTWGDIDVYDLVDPGNPRRVRRLAVSRLGDVLTTLVGERHAYVGGFEGLSIIELPR